VADEATTGASPPDHDLLEMVATVILGLAVLAIAPSSSGEHGQRS